MQIQPQNGQIDPRLAHVARLLSHQINRVRLSKTQLKVLNSIAFGQETTFELVSIICKLSPSWASTTLRRLWEKGYLERKALINEGGGITFVYQKQALDDQSI